jgi:hypothetical protein
VTGPAASPGAAWFGRARVAEFARRFRTRAVAHAGGDVRIGFLFGPRALRRFCGRPVDVVVARGVGVQQRVKRTFTGGAQIARFLAAQLNGSLRRARVDARVRVGAVGCFDAEERLPQGPFPGLWIDDLLRGGVCTEGESLAVECWGARAGVNCVIALVDWRGSRTRLERGAWGGLAPRPAVPRRAGPRFHPVAIVDLRCALTAHTAAHEFGHVLGCVHEDAAPHFSAARAYMPPGGAMCTLMAAGRKRESKRRLEWSRPAPLGGAWDWGDADHDEAAWLRVALPWLARQRFRCARSRGPH